MSIETKTQLDAEFHMACKLGDLPKVSLLATQVQGLNSLHQGRTPLGVACRFGQFEVAKYLLERGVDVNFDEFVDPALHEAVRACEPSMVRLLLEAGANPNLPASFSGELPLELALFSQSDSVAAELLNFGADFALKGSMNFAALDLIPSCTSDEVLQGLRKTPNWHSCSGRLGNSMLHQFAFWGNVKYLIAAANDGADVNLASDHFEKRTPLHIACHRGDGDVVQALLELGADLSATDIWGNRPHQIALQLGGVDAIVAIQKFKGASVFDVIDGQTLDEWYVDMARALKRLTEHKAVELSKRAEAALMKDMADAFADAGMASSQEARCRNRMLL